jgi:1-acyl-sn-glycerol-3-phosphate acyltransferase
MGVMVSSARSGSVLGRFAWATVPKVVKGVGRIAWRLEIDRRHGFPEPPFVVAANHHSFLDPLLIGAAYDDPVRFLGLVDLVGNYRWLDTALGAFEMIPVRRGTVPLGPVREALSHLRGGGVVGLFPEGTRHWEFEPAGARRGASWLAARTGVPLVPVAIEGTDKVLGVDNKLRSGRIRVEVGPGMLAGGTDRAAIDALTERWGAWVSASLGPR